MEKIIFDRIEEGMYFFISSSIHKIYLFPYGQRGTQIYRHIRDRYNFEIVRVDNGLCKTNDEVISLDRALDELIHDENSALMVSSDNMRSYTEIRLAIGKLKNRVFDVFPRHPLDFHDDKRISSASVIASDIIRRGVTGNIAEAGVYRGDFAKYLNILFPDRKLYLFDTFDGFEKTQVSEWDNSNETDLWIDALKNTNEDVVMGKMSYPEMIEIRKGLFPGTAQNLDDRFVFVSLDMDIFEPTYQGLQFFWNKMSPGGVIFVHDFGNYDGIKTAVTRFCEENFVGYFLLNDFNTACLVSPMKGLA